MIPSIESLVSGVVVNTDGASTLVVAAPGEGYKNFVTEIHIANTSVTPVTVNIRDGVSGAVKWTLMVPAGGSGSQQFVNALGGFSNNTEVAFDASAAVTSLHVSVNGFTRKTT